MTVTLAKIDKRQAAGIIRGQLLQTPIAWQEHFRQEADSLESAARIDAVHQTPFDQVIRKLKGTTSMIQLKVWCEGSTDRPIFRTLFNEVGETEIAERIGLIGGWPNLGAETEPARWLDGCRRAVIIMDGDQGRDLTKDTRPFTKHAEDLYLRFAQHPITFYVLRRHGIENYLPQHAYETVLERDLSAYFSLPETIAIDDHLCEPGQPSFYHKSLNKRAAQHLKMTHIEGTDLADIIRDVAAAAAETRRY
jgi:hypothetical protein